MKQLDVADAEGLATQLQLLVDGAIALDLVRKDPSLARAAKEAAKVLLTNAGVEVGGETAPRPARCEVTPLPHIAAVVTREGG